MKIYTDILPKMDASQATEVKDFVCPECGKSAISGFNGEEKPTLVGWCETDYGYMMIVECPKCFTKYSFHGTANFNDKFDIAAFNHSIHLYVLGKYFSNSDEL